MSCPFTEYDNAYASNYYEDEFERSEELKEKEDYLEHLGNILCDQYRDERD